MPKRGFFMSSKTKVGIIATLLEFCVGVMLLIGGIWALMNGGDEAAAAVSKLFGSGVIKLAFGVVELVAGLFLVLRVFIGDKLGAFGNILMIIIAVLWLIGIFCADVIGFGTGSAAAILSNLYKLVRDLIIFAAILVNVRF